MSSRGILFPVAAGIVAGVVSSLSASWLHGARGAAPAPVVRPIQKSHEAEYAEALARHAGEAPDPAWADTATRAFAAEAGALAGTSRFSVTGVDCRRTSCVVGLRWSNYGEVTADSRRIRTSHLQHPQGKLN